VECVDALPRDQRRDIYVIKRDKRVNGRCCQLCPSLDDLETRRGKSGNEMSASRRRSDVLQFSENSETRKIQLFPIGHYGITDGDT
jgi:hypothetical protein